MKLSTTALAAIAACTVMVEAAPAPIVEKASAEMQATKRSDVQLMTPEQQLAKRDDLERALAQFKDLQEMRVKRDDLAAELDAREYAIVTEVLTAIKDTDLAPVVLKYFSSSTALKTVAAEAVLYIVKSGLISVTTLLDYLVQSGLLTSVVNDVLGDCEVFASIFSIAKSLVSNFLSKSKRSEKTEPYTQEEALELFRREGLLRPRMLENYGEDKRAVEDIILNVLESLADSGLASQVVETVLTDSLFLKFGVELITELVAADAIKVSSLLSAVKLSGLISALFTDLFKISTLEKIGTTALEAFKGDCSSSTATTTNSTSTSTTSTSSTSTSTSTSSSLLLSLLGGSSILSTVGSLLSGLFSSSSSSSSSSTTTATTTTAAVATSTVAAASVNACETSAAKRSIKNLRLNY